MLGYINHSKRAVSSAWESATMALWRSPVRARYGPQKDKCHCPFFFCAYTTMIPKQIRLSRPEELGITWDDGHESVISLRTLRDHCPCAGCQGETVLLRTYKPEPGPALPGKYDLVGVETIGHYALQASWGDGHRTGIYPWLVLRSLCECPLCLSQK
jgi:DUF971 family protein